MDEQLYPHDDRPIRAATRRLCALVIGPLYLLGVIEILSAVTRTSWGLTAFYVAVGSIVIMVVFTMFGVKAYRYREARLRFDLGTLFLVTIPLAIYMTAIGWLVRSAEVRSAGAEGAWLVIPLALLFILTANGCLLLLAEALVWCAARMVNIWGRMRKSRL